MPFYRGIDQAALLTSIENGLSLLEKHPLGRECKKIVDDIRATQLDAIRKATTDKQLVDAMRSSEVQYLFARLNEVMACHAHNDTDGVGRSTFDVLSSWDCFNLAMMAVYTPLDLEKDLWLMTTYTRAIAKGVKLSADDQAELDKAIATDEKVAKGMDLVLDAVKKSSGKSDKELRAHFSRLDAHEKYLLTMVGSVMSGMSYHDLPKKSAMSRYCLVVNDLTSGKINYMDKQVENIRMDLGKVLNAFYALDEVGSTGIGFVSYDCKKGDPMGITFETTRRAAEAVARAMPGYVVLDNTKKPVKGAAAKKSQPKP